MIRQLQRSPAVCAGARRRLAGSLGGAGNMRNTGVLAVVGAVFAAACGDDTDPDKRVFRDDFDSLVSGWELSEGAEVENGSLFLAAGADGSPNATYTFPTPYGPGWELESSFSLTAGVVSYRPDVDC